MDNIMAQLQIVNQMVNSSKQDQRDNEGCVLLELKSCNDSQCKPLLSNASKAATAIMNKCQGEFNGGSILLRKNAAPSSPQGSGPSECHMMG